MTTQADNSGEAVKSAEPTPAPAPLWERMQELGTTDVPRSEEGTNPMVFLVGIVALVGLAVLCFAMTLSNGRRSVSPTVAAHYLPPTTPHFPGTQTRTSIPSRAASQPVTLTPPPMPVVLATTPSKTWSSQEEKDRVAGLLADCRVAYEMSGTLSQRWMTAVNTAIVPNAVAVNSSAGAQNMPHPLTNEDWNIIDGQIDAIDGTIAIATQPSRYPEALQDTSMDLGREMRTFLQTTRAALSATDPQVRSELQARASTHRSKAGEMLSKLEASLQEKVAQTPAYETTAN